MNLKELRQRENKTIAEIAKALGVTDRAIGNYEAGRRNMSLENVLKLAKIYDCSAEEIINAQLKSNVGKTD